MQACRFAVYVDTACIEELFDAARRWCVYSAKTFTLTLLSKGSFRCCYSFLALTCPSPHNLSQPRRAAAELGMLLLPLGALLRVLCGSFA